MQQDKNKEDAVVMVEFVLVVERFVVVAESVVLIGEESTGTGDVLIGENGVPVKPGTPGLPLCAGGSPLWPWSSL